MKPHHIGSETAAGWHGAEPQMGRSIQTTIVIPAYNEEHGLGQVIEGLVSVINHTYEIVVVDDGSSDRTAEVAVRYPCRVLRHEVNLGKAAAMRTGIAAARGENIVFIDADGTYPAHEVSVIAEALQVYDMVVTTRNIGRQHIPVFNRLGNLLFRNLLCRLYGVRLSDPLTGLYGLRRKHLERMDLASRGFAIEAEIAIKAARMGLATREIPIQYGERIGASKLNPIHDGLRIVRLILTLARLYNPTMTFIMPGLLFFLAGLPLLVVLLLQPVTVMGITFSIHTFIFATMAVLVGTQLMIFGGCSKLYALAHRFTCRDLVTSILLGRRTMAGLTLVGLASLLGGLAVAAKLALSWARTGYGPFFATQETSLAAFLVVFGVQLLFSVTFLSIFTEEVRISSGPQQLPITLRPGASVRNNTGYAP